MAAVSGERAAVKPGAVIGRVDPSCFRPTEVETLLGDPTRAREKLGWVPRTTFAELVAEMVESDYTSARRDHLVKKAGFQAFDYHEQPAEALRRCDTLLRLSHERTCPAPRIA